MDYGRPELWSELANALAYKAVATPTSDCGLVDCEPTWSWAPRLTDFDLWLAVSGTGIAVLGDARCALEPGSVLVLRPGDTPLIDHDRSNPLRVAYCHFNFIDPSTGNVVSPPPELLPSRHVALHNPYVVHETVRRLVRLRHDQRPLVQLEREVEMRRALLDIYRDDADAQGHSTATMDPRIQLVVNHVRAHPHLRLTLEEAAKLTGLSQVYFSRLFTLHLGSSFRHFLLEVRMDRANLLLTETTMQFSDIARSLGYDDYYLFSRQVRLHTGRSPSQIRKARSRTNRPY